MKDFNKSDIAALDFIVSHCLETDFSVNADDLIKSGHIKLINEKGYGTLSPQFDASKEFKRYLGIIEKHGVCDCVFTQDGEFASSNSKTFNFQKQGGFKALYKDLKKENKRNKLEFELAESNIKANRLNEKNAKKNNIATAINIIIGILNFGALIWQMFRAE